MVTRESLIKDLNQEVKTLNKKIRLVNYYNKRNKIFLAFIKSLKFFNKILPYIVGFTLSSATLSKSDLSPFKDNKVIEYSSVSETKTSTDDIYKKESFTEQYETSFIYSTGWKINDKNLYERCVYTFNYNDIVNYSIEDILNMSKDEICSLFTIYNIENIQKTSLSEEDYIYNENMVLITSVYENQENYQVRSQYWYEIAFSFLVYFFIAYFYGAVIDKIIIKDRIKNRLETYEREFKNISFEDIKAYKKILQIKMDNLSVLGIDDSTIKKLKKVK